MTLPIARAAACVGAAYLVNKLYRFYVAVSDQERCMREVRAHLLKMLTDRSPQLEENMRLPRDLLCTLRDEMVQQVHVLITTAHQPPTQYRWATASTGTAAVKC